MTSENDFMIFFGKETSIKNAAKQCGSSCPPGTVSCKRPFSTVDSDASGAISESEFLAVYPWAGASFFQMLDSDGDGVLSEEEYAAFVYCRTPNSGDPYC